MSNLQDKFPLRLTILSRLKRYGQNANKLGGQVRQKVFGFHLNSNTEHEHESLLQKIRSQRLLQRRRVFRQAGGDRSSMARYALKKARHDRQQP